jgi:hypothetical protein
MNQTTTWTQVTTAILLVLVMAVLMTIDQAIPLP